MITDIPTSDDFTQSGIEFLNLAWDNALELLINFDEWKIAGVEEFGDVEPELERKARTEAYWKSAYRRLATAAALTQQGVELLLKGRIAQSSVFLLISGDPRDWPRKADKEDTPFADFRTIDAQDLIRAHDTVSPTRLSDQFKDAFDKLRRLRNSVFHTVDKRISVEVQEVVRTILYVSSTLVGHHRWIRVVARFS